MKIGIITFHNASNYGAVLQAFALQEYIKKFNENVEIIDYANRFITKGLNKVRFELSLKGLYYFFQDILHYKKRKNKINNFLRFFSDYLVLSPRYKKGDFEKGMLNYDIGVSGSDQIWNPLLNVEIDPVYYLAFPGVKRKISYGSSFGAYHFDNEKENEKIKRFLGDYSYISLRDDPTRLSNLLNCNVFHHCDPTLLLTKREWGTRLGLKSTTEKYCLVYCLTNFQNILPLAIDIAERLNMKVKVLGDVRLKTKKGKMEILDDAGPVDFVDSFYNAKFVITNSFHGTVFAVNFGIPFISIRNDKSPERAETFLKKIGASNRLVHIDKLKYSEKLFAQEIDYSNEINKDRESAFAYLKMALME